MTKLASVLHGLVDALALGIRDRHQRRPHRLAIEDRLRRLLVEGRIEPDEIVLACCLDAQVAALPQVAPRLSDLAGTSEQPLLQTRLLALGLHEQELARQDGCRFIFEAGPVAILGSGEVEGIKVVMMKAVAGRSPEPVAGTEQTIQCDIVIKANGQTTRSDFWNQMKADALGSTYQRLVDSDLSTLRGDALIAGRARGWPALEGEAARPRFDREYQPDAAMTERYEQVSLDYEAMARGLDPVMAGLNKASAVPRA